MCWVFKVFVIQKTHAMNVALTDVLLMINVLLFSHSQTCFKKKACKRVRPFSLEEEKAETYSEPFVKKSHGEDPTNLADVLNLGCRI